MTELDTYDGCSRECERRGKHSLRWGACEHAIRPEPRLGFFRTTTGEDGHTYGYTAEIPLAAFLPWVKHLTTDQRWQMLEEVSDAEDPAEVVQRWQWSRDVMAGQEAEEAKKESAYWEEFRRHVDAQQERRSRKEGAT